MRPPWASAADPGRDHDRKESRCLKKASALHRTRPDGPRAWTSASVPFRRFDEDVLRTLRGLRPHPLPLALDPERTRGALPREAAAVTAVSGGEALRSLHCAARSAVQVPLRAAPRGEDLKEAGGLRPPASFKTSPLPRLDSLLGMLTGAGGGPPLTCTALRAARRKCRYGLLREGQGWGWRTTTAVRHAPVARP